MYTYTHHVRIFSECDEWWPYVFDGPWSWTLFTSHPCHHCHPLMSFDTSTSDLAQSDPFAPLVCLKKRANFPGGMFRIFCQLMALALVTRPAASNGSCLASIKVIDNFLTDEEAQVLLSDINSKLPSDEQTNTRFYISGHQSMHGRLEETMSTVPGVQKFLVNTQIPVSYKHGDVEAHHDHVNGNMEEGLVKGSSALVYLHSAADGGSLGRISFKNKERLLKDSWNLITLVIICHQYGYL